MFTNYLLVSLRNMKKFKAFSFINILGLAVGITCFLLLALFIYDETGYDSYHKNADQLYRLYVSGQIGAFHWTNAKAPAPLGPTMKQEFPEVENYVRVAWSFEPSFRYKEKHFRDGNIYWADSTFFDMFSAEVISGDLSTALNKPNTVVVTESAAKRYFGDENPIGILLHTDQGVDLTVTALIRDFPRNCHFHFDFLGSLATIPDHDNDHWLDVTCMTYVRLRPGTDPNEVDRKLVEATKRWVAPAVKSALGITVAEFDQQGNHYTHCLQPVTSIHLYSHRKYGIDTNTEWSDSSNSDIEYIYLFGAIALFLLVIAIINFMNLTTARSERRAKEVGIRKTLGASRLMVIVQFLTESLIISAVAVIISLVFLWMVLPFFNSFSGKQLTMDFLKSPVAIFSLLGFLLLLGLVSGSYPAFYLSRFNPVSVLKSGGGKTGRKSRLRSALVIVQFTISIVLIIGTIIIHQQIDYIRTKHLGFNKEQLLLIRNAGWLSNSAEAFRAELLKNPNVKSATTVDLMFRSGIPGSGYLYECTRGAHPYAFQYLFVDDNFTSTYEVKVKSGRFFSDDFPSDTDAVVINEATVRELGVIDPIGKALTSIGSFDKGKSYKIIGVVNDFNYESLHQTIRPIVLYRIKPHKAADNFAVRIAGGNVHQTIEDIRTIWKKFIPDEDFYYSFLNQDIDKLYDSEEKIGLIASIFAGIAIFIACLGLFGLAAFTTEQRTKEIGIRKIMGAGIREIIIELTREFTVWVLIANVIAWPLAYYVTDKWLQGFAYRISIPISDFFIAGIIAMVIAIATVSLQTIKTAMANPVTSLRYE